MSAEKSISIASGLVGVAGSFLLARGVLQWTPEFMVILARTYWGYNPFELDSMATQKADFLCGIALIVLAFFYHIIKESLGRGPRFRMRLHSAVERIVAFPARHSPWLWLSAIPVAIVWFIAQPQLASTYRFETRKAAAIEAFKRDLTDGEISIGDFDMSITSSAEYLLGIVPGTDESRVDFLNRYATFLDVEIPDSVELSELETTTAPTQ